MHVYTRLDLTQRDAGHPDGPRLLLEGSWPEPSEVSRDSIVLDDEIDSRYGWIDEAASELAERIAGRSLRDAAPAEPTAGVTFAWLNVLKLRYFLVKLLRVVTLVDAENWSNRYDTIQLSAEPGRDDVYVDLMQSICRSHGLRLNVDDSIAAVTSSSPRAPVTNGIVRQTAGVVSSWLDRLRGGSVAVPRIVFVGDQAVLGDVCAESLARGHRAWWLFDRFCASAFTRWGTAGAGQLTCNSSRGRVNKLDLHAQSWPWYARGIDLTPPIHRWLREQAGAGEGARSRTNSASQTRMVERIDRHFNRVRPTHVVLDEDATPLARAAIAMAQRYGATTSVVQHGAPFVRFGFVPSIADQSLVWGESSRQRLVDWGAAPQTIQVTGSPKHDRPARRSQPLSVDRRREILLLLTVPPRDDRPDAVCFHLTSATYAAMLRSAMAAVAELDVYELVVRPHPRASNTSLCEQIAQQTPKLRYRIGRDESLADAVDRAQVVLSCASSAGVDAVRRGARVVQLMPVGSDDALVAEHWGMCGTARSLDELRPLLDRALHSQDAVSDAASANVFVDRAEPAAWRIVDAIVGAENIADQNAHPTLRFDAAHTLAGPRGRRSSGGLDERRAA